MLQLTPRLALVSLLWGFGLMAACGGDGRDKGDFDGEAQPDSGQSVDDAATDGPPGFNTDGGVVDSGPDTCAESKAEATLRKIPVDIVFMIDNSTSMSAELDAVRENLNTRLASILDAAEVDYTVTMITRHGNNTNTYLGICVTAPLSTTNCTPIPAQPGNNPPKFNHFDVNLDSYNSVCKMLESYPTWKDWIREDSRKVFVEVSDDRLNCSFGGNTYNDRNSANDGNAVAPRVDQAILALDPAYFGTVDERKYVWHSLVGVVANNPAEAPYLPDVDLIASKCTQAVNPGYGYQSLSRLTGGLRFPVCDGNGFSAVFEAIAADVIEGTKVDCNFPIPTAPDGAEIDPETVAVEYTENGDGAVRRFEQVENAAACTDAPDSFYIEEGVIQLCTATCELVREDPAAQVGIAFGCKGDGPR